MRSYIKLLWIKINRTRLSTLTISQNESHPAYLIQAATNNPSIQTFCMKLRYTNFTPVLWNALTQLVSKSRTIQALDFDFVGLDDQGLQTLAPHLKKNPNLKKLNLQRNNITAIGGTALADIIKNSNNLEELVVSANPLGKGFNDIFLAIQNNSHLTSLVISTKFESNGINDTHVDDLIEMIKDNKTLKQLNLCGNEFSDQGIQKLCKGLLMNKTLTAVNLDSETIGDPGCVAISEWIGKTTSLQSLSLGYEVSRKDSITDVGLTKLTDALKSNSSIKHLSLSFKKDSDALAVKMAELLESNQTIETLALKNCPNAMTQKGTAALVIALKNNTSVYEIVEGERVVMLPSSEVDPNTANELRRLLARNKALKAIKENPSALPQLVKNISNSIIDEVFITTIIKSLPEPLMLKYEQLLIDLMRGHHNSFATLKTWLGVNRNIISIANVISLLALQAEAGDAPSQMTLGYLYKNQLLDQALDPKQATACFMLATASTDKKTAANANFEIGHLHFIYTNDLLRAASHFDKASGQACIADQKTNEQAGRLRDRAICMLNNTSTLALPDTQERKTQLHSFHQKNEVLAGIKSFFTSFNKTLSNTQRVPFSQRVLQTPQQQDQPPSAIPTYR